LRSQVDYQGLIISFEPIQKNAVILQDRAKRDNRWFTYPYALGSTNTNRTLNVMKSDEFSSFSTPDHSAVDAYRDMNVVDHEELVEIRRLDDIIGELDREHELRHIFLKMDTQGHDLEIFKGSKETLSRVLALQSEVSVKPIYASIPDYFTAIRTFTEAGFDVAGLFPVNTIEGRVIEFDCVMINKVAGRTSKFAKRSDSQGIE
jgi:FkbM family methyltransferase